MAKTIKGSLLGRYREQMREAKEAYKAERGLKIARGFSQSEEARRIARNRARAIGRYEQRKESAGAEKFARRTSAERDKVAGAQAKEFRGEPSSAPPEPQRQAGRFDVIADAEPFWAVMKGERGEQSEAADQFDIQGESTKAKTFLAAIHDENGNTRIFRDKASFEKAIEEEYQRLAEEQRDISSALKAVSKARRDGKEPPAGAAATLAAKGAIGSAGRLCSLSIGVDGDAEILVLTIH